MDYLNQLAVQYDGIISLLGVGVGFAGFVFGAWRYLRERKAQQTLKDKQQKLDQALARLQHLEKYDSGLNRYSKAV